METETKRCRNCGEVKGSDRFRPQRAVCRECEREADRARRARAKHGAEPEAPAPEVAPEPEPVRKLTGDEAAAAMQHYGLYLHAIEGEPSPVMQMRDGRRGPDGDGMEYGQRLFIPPAPYSAPVKLKPAPIKCRPPARILAGKTYCIKGLRP